MPDQIYALAVKLHVPDSTHNFGLGNFMVSLALLSEKNVTLVEASRPALLNYKSPLQRTLLTLWRMVPLVLFNRGTETQTLVVQLIEGFQDSEVSVSSSLHPSQ